MNRVAIIGCRVALLAASAFDRRYARVLLDLAFGASVQAIVPALPLERDDSLAILRCSLVDSFDKTAGFVRIVGQLFPQRAHQVD
jgi:hypothetical protein